MKVIFLDIDGVLNSEQFFIKNHEEVINFYKTHEYDSDDIDLLIKLQMFDIDFAKVAMLKNVIDDTNAKIVVTSSWKKLKVFPYIADKLIKYGLPIIGYTIDNGFDRGSGINKYLSEHEINDYVILDDDIFDDYDEEIINKLVKTNFYDGGLKDIHVCELIKRLKKSEK